MRPRADHPQNSTADGQPPEAALQAQAESPSLSNDGPRVDGVAQRLDRSPQVERLEAVASLIGDESDAVRSALLREFRRAGRLGRTHLQRAARSDDARARSHARRLLDALHQDDVVRRLCRIAGRGVADFESAMFSMARFERPALDARPYLKALDAIALEVERRSRHLTDDLRRGQVLVHYLGTELGYRGDLESYTHPDNIYLHRVIERKQGLPLSLCALYSFVARRCSIHTGIVPLPGHVMLRLYGRHHNLIVDPFHGGESKSQEDLVDYLKQHGLKFDPVWMHDASPKMLLHRQLANLQNSWRATRQRERSPRLNSLLRQLAN